MANALPNAQSIQQCQSITGKTINSNSKQKAADNKHMQQTFVVLSILPSSTTITSYENLWSTFCKQYTSMIYFP